MRPATLLSALVFTTAPPSWAQTVRAVLFHSPTCPHCRQVISQDLPVFFDVYGGTPQVVEGPSHLALITNGQLAILFVDASQPAGGSLYESSLMTHPVNAERLGVPRLVVGDSVLVGSVEIPSRLHGLIRSGLATGGIDWPGIPGVVEAIEGMGQTAEREEAAARPAEDTAGGTAAQAAGTAEEAEGGTAEDTTTVDSAALERAVPRSLADLGAERSGSVGERVRRDPVGNGLAVALLGVMVLVLAAVAIRMPARLGPRMPGVWLPLLAMLGAGVAAYLAYIEATGSAAVCGPVGDCNTVQQSPYATLFGLIPVGLLGLTGYGAILVLWVLGQDRRRTARLARRTLVAVALVGTVFSIYLTALEPFIIGAICLWCLSSAAAMTGLLWLAAAWSGPDPRSSRGRDRR